VAATAKKNSDKEIEESKRFDKVVRQIAAQEKKEFKRKMWDLETKLEAANFKYISAQRKTDAANASLEASKIKIEELETKYKTDIKQLEERIEAEQMHHLKLQKSIKKRMLGLADKFQRKIMRRKTKAEINLKNELAHVTRKIKIEQEKTTEALRVEGAKDLDAVRKEFKASMLELNKEMDAAEKKSRKHISDLKATHKSELNYLKVTNEKGKEAIISETNVEIKKVEAEAQRVSDKLKMDMNQVMKQSRQEKETQEEIIRTLTLTLANNEAERRSFRKLAKMTWKVTREKFTGKGKAKSPSDGQD